jgi:hypothetical protein
MIHERDKSASLGIPNPFGRTVFHDLTLTLRDDPAVSWSCWQAGTWRSIKTIAWGHAPAEAAFFAVTSPEAARVDVRNGWFVAGLRSTCTDKADDRWELLAADGRVIQTGIGWTQ